MNKFLEGKTAIVTGGTRGIGRAIAHSLAAAGAAVGICGRSQDGTEKAVAELAAETTSQIIGKALDVRSDAAVTAFFEYVDSHFSEIDILVNNAGIGIFSPVGSLSFEDWRATIETNLSGCFYCCREALPRMQRDKGGYIFNISSLAGKNPFAGGAAYNASKFGMNGFSEALMLDHRRDNIRVTYIMPGSVDTDFSSRTESAPWKIAPQDIADIVLALLRLPERTTVSRVEVRPSVPPK